jgi:site-specific recombinase XerC
MLFKLLLRAGLRLGSALGLDVQDLDLVEGTARIRAKGGRRERVFLPAATRGELAAFLAGRTRGPVFASQSGRRLSPRHVQRRFAQVRVTAGLPAAVTCHSLRHSFGTALLARSGDIELVRRALSHRSVSSTQVYARCGDDRLRAAVGA